MIDVSVPSKTGFGPMSVFRTKKCNFDRPDGLAMYWYALKQESRRFQMRQSEGGSVMIWKAISVNNKSLMVCIYGKK